MTKFIASLVLASVLATSAHAYGGMALRDAAQAHQLTPGGVFDGR